MLGMIDLRLKLNTGGVNRMSTKVRFDLGASNGVALNLIGVSLHKICRDMEEELGLQSAKCTAFLQFYDKDGVAQDVTDKNGRSISYTLRPHPYKRKPKDAVLLGNIGNERNKIYIYERYGI